jgi:hypothetical protein
MTPIALLCGIPSEPPLALAARALDRLGAPYLVLNQRLCSEYHIDFTLSPEGLHGELALGDQTVPLEAVRSVYTRLMDHQCLPEVARAAPGDPLRVHARRFHETLWRWLDVTPAVVVNRLRAGHSNNSKPYQAQVIRKYFFVPESLVTNDPGAALAFRERHGRVVYKSVSGERSIVAEFGDADLDRLDDLPNCPVLFQQYVEGLEVRVHTVGGRVFATAVESDAIDYRYGHRQGASQARFTAVEAPEDVARACVDLAGELGLGLAGLDLRFAPDGAVHCLEVNPSPAYSCYEEAAGQPISQALACCLAGRGPAASP